MLMKQFTLGVAFVAGSVVSAASAAPPSPQWQAWIAQHAAALRAAWAARVAANPGLAQNPVEPSITAGKILTPRIDVTRGPGLPTVQVTLDAGTVGTNAIGFSFTSPSGAQFAQGMAFVPTYPPQGPAEKLPFEVRGPFYPGPFGYYAEAGTWTLTGVMLFADDGTFVSYSGAQLAALFSSLSLKVANPGTPDTTPPAVIAGKLLTPTISLSATNPMFIARLTATDNVCGVQNVSVGLQPPDNQFPTGAFGGATAPQLKARLYATYALSSTSPVGTWLMTSFSECDYANNCFTDTSATDVQKLFGTTTFKVTN